MSDLLAITEVDSDGLIVGLIGFDLDDFDAAVAELDARYLAGEAASHARACTVVTEAFYAVNRREIPATASGFIDVDHRRVTGIGDGALMSYLTAAYDDLAENRLYVEVIHRLTGRGAVVTHVAKGTSQQGFYGEWRLIDVLTVDGELIDRCEMYDEDDLEAALARFDELNAPTSRLENAATRAHARFQDRFLAHDWDGLADTVAADHCSDDRRSVVNSGIVHGRAAEVASMHAMAELGATNLSSVVLAVRGDRLALCRIRGAVGGPDGFYNEVHRIVEVDGDGRIVARVVFDHDGFEAALDELDARYLRGEAASHTQVWEATRRVYAAANQHEPPLWADDFESIDHRSTVASAPGELAAYLEASWDVAPSATIFVEAVHRLTDGGVLVTYSSSGSSRDGFDAEWRGVTLTMFDDGKVARSEMFDETDLDAALARFDELAAAGTRLENTASRSYSEWLVSYAARDWTAMSAVMAEGVVNDDRRRVVNGGVQHGRHAVIANMRAIAEVGVNNIEPLVLAIRGGRLALFRLRVSGNSRPDAFGSDVVIVVEADTEGRFACGVAFDLEDLDAALSELDNRYLTGEAREHARTWSLVVQTYAAFNRHELSKTTPDWVNVDHRPGVGSARGDMSSNVSAMWSLVPDVRTRIEAVHRLTDLGAVFTHTECGSSAEGFDAEWREVALLTFDGDVINRCELYDEAGLDAALARFDELG